MDSTSWPASSTFVRVSRFASSIATERRAKYPPTPATAMAAAVPRANRPSVERAVGGPERAPRLPSVRLPATAP